jgi:ABC-type antimicrobial peptide transport system permease subunit
VFVPFGQLQLSLGTPALFLRADGNPDAFAGVVRRELQDVDPSLPYVDVQPLTNLVAPQMRSWRLGTVLFGVFALMAVAMAGCGVFGVVAYNVAQRQREFGIRIALGAKRESLMLLIMRQTIAVIASGLALGILIAWLGGPALDPLLMGITGHDSRAFALVATVIGAIALAACVVPAWAASKISPAQILRAP